MDRIVAVVFSVAVCLAAAAPESHAQTPAFLTDALTVTLDGVPVGQPLTPLGNSLRYTVAYDPETSRYHLWTMGTDTDPLILPKVVHGTSRNGIAFESDGLLGYLGGNPFPGPFGTTAEPEANFLNALAIGAEWKLLVWSPNDITGSSGQYNYNTSVNSFGTTPDNRLLVHQGRVGPQPGGVGVGGMHVGAFGIVNGKLYLRVDDLIGGLGRFTYTDGFLPAGPTSSSWGQHTTANLFTGTPWVWGLSNPSAPNAAYVHNQGRTFVQPDGSIGTYYGFRRWDGTRAEKQLWFVRSTDDGLTWSLPAAVFASPNAVTIDGTPIPADGFFSTVDAAVAGTGQRLYFSAKNAANQVVLITTATFRLAPAALAVDSLGNGVLEVGESARVEPAWENLGTTAVAFGGVLDNFTGPGTATYTVLDEVAFYGTAAGGSTVTCGGAGDCYAVYISASPRPAVHWDATADESLSSGESKAWTLHVGDSFTDVPRSSPFYRFVETLLHADVTGGCTPTTYCPSSDTRREEMAVFVLVAKEAAGYVPPACVAGSEEFADVPAGSPFCRWIEELARRGVVAGCGGGNFCPTSSTSREQMSVFVLRTLDPALDPPACVAGAEEFSDVPASSAFCRWIEELARRGVVAGCGGGLYCPADPVSREQMAVFISVTFGLPLYGP